MFHEDYKKGRGNKMYDCKAIALEYFDKLLNEKDISVCDRLLSDDYTDSDVPEGTPPGPNEPKEYVSNFISTYPDIKVTVKDAIAEDNKAALRIIWYGTNKETEEKLHKMGNIILIFNDKGQIKRRWSAYVNL